MTRTERNVARALAALAFLYSMSAHAGLQRINGLDFETTKPVYADGIPTEAGVEQEKLPIQSSIFTPEEGEGMARASRLETGRRKRGAADKQVEECFGFMKEAAADGACDLSFFAEDALCNGDEEPTGCYENKRFRSKAEHLGFRVKKREAPTANWDDHCASITVQWCRDLRQRR